MGISQENYDKNKEMFEKAKKKRLSNLRKEGVAIRGKILKLQNRDAEIVKAFKEEKEREFPPISYFQELADKQRKEAEARKAHLEGQLKSLTETDYLKD